MSTSNNIKKEIVLIKESSIAEIQEMLEKQAKDGWYFTGKKACIYYFEKKKSKDLKYRLLPNEDKPTDKEIEMYKQDGWEYVDNLSRTAIFCGEKDAKEIKLQPKKTEKIQSKIKSEIVFQIAFIFVISVVALISWISLTFSKGYFWKNIADNWNSNFSIPLVYLALIVFAITLLIDKLDFYKAFNKLPVNREGNIKRKKRLFKIRIIYTTILLSGAVVIFVATLVTALNGVNGRNTLKYDGKNMVSLMDVEETESFYTKKQYENLGIVKNVNSTPVYDGVYSISKSFICKEHLTWDEELECETEKYSAELQGEYYNLYNKKIAKKIYKELIKNLENEVKNSKKFAIVIPEKKYKKYKFDDIYIVEYSNYYAIIVREKNEVFNIDFNGKNDYLKVLEYIQNIYTRRKVEKSM